MSLNLVIVELISRQYKKSNAIFLGYDGYMLGERKLLEGFLYRLEVDREMKKAIFQDFSINVFLSFFQEHC